MQWVSAFYAEIINYLVIHISESVSDVVKDFLALEVIAHLDNILSREHLNSLTLQVCNQMDKGDMFYDFFKVNTTTSRSAIGQSKDQRKNQSAWKGGDECQVWVDKTVSELKPGNFHKKSET